MHKITKICTFSAIKRLTVSFLVCYILEKLKINQMEIEKWH